MVIESFNNGDATPVYVRFRDEGRQMPDGLEYISSWITSDLGTCYQVMKCDDRALLDQWMSRWDDLMSFGVIPVITAAEASAEALSSG